MCRVLAAFGAALVLAGPLGGAPARAETAPDAQQIRDKALVEATRKALAAFKAEDYEAVHATLGDLKPDRVAKAPTAMQQDIWTMLGLACIHTGRRDEALAAFRRIIALPGHDGYGWYLTAIAAPPDIDLMMQAASTLARDYPAWLARMPADMTLSAHAMLLAQPDGEARQFAFGEALLDLDWTPDTPFADASYMWVGHAAALLERGQEARAARAALKVTDPEQIIAMRADRRFDPIVRTAEGSFDPRAAALENLARLRKAAAAQPRSLHGVVALADALSTVGRREEALAGLNAALAAARAPEGPGFTDLAGFLPWALDVKAGTLAALGRDDEALAAYAEAARLPEYEGGNTNHALNYGGQLLDRARAAEALAVIGPVGDMTPYGEGVKLWITACAHAQLGQQDAARRNMEALKAVQQHNPSAAYTGAVCLGDVDAAAELLIGQLRDPSMRGRVLVLLQKIEDGAEEAPTDRPPFVVAWKARDLAVQSRPDVLAQVELVGRIETYDLREDRTP